MYKFVVFSPRDDRIIRSIIHAASSAGAGTIGDYNECAFVSEGYSTFRPMSGARPTEGQVHEFTRREEVRIEMDCPKEKLRNVLTAIQAIHPYDKVAIDAVEVHRIE
jgi:hypothetical protein